MASGLLLHVTSLPSPYGVGDLRPSALSWIDRLHDAGQEWWQALPVGPTGCGNSPYQSLSSFAGNALLISPECLISDGLVLERRNLRVVDNVRRKVRLAIARLQLERAWTNFRAGRGEDLRVDFEEYCADQASWLEDYALFRALKWKYQGACYLEWPAELVQRRPKALANARRDLLNLGSEARMNLPGHADGNWRWRFTEEKLSLTAFQMAAATDGHVE